MSDVWSLDVVSTIDHFNNTGVSDLGIPFFLNGLVVVIRQIFESVSQPPQLSGQDFSEQPSIASTEVRQVARQIETILNDQAGYRRLLSQRGELAQAILDLLQTLYDYPEVTPELRSKICKAMIHLSRKSSLCPTCLTLNNVEKLGEHPVAAGGFADIWKGSLGKQVTCLKIPRLHVVPDRDKLLKSFMEEAILWRQLEHPNVLPFLGLYFLESNPKSVSLISPWMDNGDLSSYLKNHARDLEAVDREVLAYDIAKGLSYLHEKKIIHGDLKGPNVLITASHRAVLSDFGLSRVITEGLPLTMTNNSIFGGTTRWLAPECVIQNQRVSFESDIYAFGCVCYEIFTGNIPFHEYLQDGAVIHQLQSGQRPARPSNDSVVNDGIWTIMQGCWHEDPSTRPRASALPDQLVLATKRKIDPAEEWNDSLFSQLWRNIRHPELCPPGSDLEKFLFSPTLQSTVQASSGDNSNSTIHSITFSPPVLETSGPSGPGHPLDSGRLVDDLRKELEEIIDVVLRGGIEPDIAGTLNQYGTEAAQLAPSSPATSNPDAQQHPVRSQLWPSPKPSKNLSNPSLIKTEADTFLKGLRFMH
ncbi:kinase-like protein [Dendrothele bispora CBS 962.96]|uniref:Kinase-like protein n=1 Tax=Dendrothele bispora (strain CBS 962.96) TaxID=1314807 RepID=A0A4S8LWK8_DENBC|nr:kinase-like protein [Dendrothele bispora CBS 962.96]